MEEGIKHRGLIEIDPDLDEAKKHIQKAEHNFKAVFTMEKSGLLDWSVNAVFYTIYHCFLGIIAKFGYESRNQECTIALVEHLKEQKKIILSTEIIEALKIAESEEKNEKSAIVLRENFQYGTETKIEDKTLSELKGLSQKAIEETKKIIYNK
tara:strand:+ start:1336 stop:1794 length:459 start_codon:yes stop_codon:yes gene_type:complete